MMQFFIIHFVFPFATGWAMGTGAAIAVEERWWFTFALCVIAFVGTFWCHWI